MRVHFSSFVKTVFSLLFIWQNVHVTNKVFLKFLHKNIALKGSSISCFPREIYIEYQTTFKIY